MDPKVNGDNDDDSSSCTSSYSNNDIVHHSDGNKQEEMMLSSSSTTTSTTTKNSKSEKLSLPMGKDIKIQPSSTSSPRSASSTKEQSLTFRCIIHMDVNCFYCQCEELRYPHLAARPFAVGQKQIVVTCNYIARSRGVRKLMLRSEARKLCPELIIIEGSDLRHYRKYARLVYNTFRSIVQKLLAEREQEESEGGCIEKASIKCRKGGMDEMYADVTSLVQEKNTTTKNNRSLSKVNLDGEEKQTATNVDEQDEIVRVTTSELVASKNDSTHKEKHGELTFQQGKSFYIYGDYDSTSSSNVSITEDQTGATSHVPSPCTPVATGETTTSPSLRIRRDTDGMPDQSLSDVQTWGTTRQRKECARRLKIAASKAGQFVQSQIKDQTGFTTCVGVSVNPMLAKLASELKKPDSINVLFPWRSSAIIRTMPLRKIPELGSRTLKVLTPCLEEHNPGKKPLRENEFWTCQDLLNVPHNDVLACLSKLISTDTSSERQCEVLLQRCHGIDHATIEDDNGGVPKTVSVEDSYPRGSVTTREVVLQSMEHLYRRLPRLLDDRRSSSDKPDLAFPTTIRLTVRTVVENVKHNGRPFLTNSKQCRFDGKGLLLMNNPAERSNILRISISPLLHSLVFNRSATRKDFDITRINIAATNFMDFENRSEKSRPDVGQNQRIVTQFFPPFGTQRLSFLTQDSSDNEGTHKADTHIHEERQDEKLFNQSAGVSFFSSSEKKRKREVNALGFTERRFTSSTRTEKTSYAAQPALLSVDDTHRNGNQSCDLGYGSVSFGKRKPNDIPGIDPDVLAELPPDIVEEVIKSYGMDNSKIRKRNTREGGIEHFFTKKK